MQAWAEGPDVESRISLAPIAVQLTLAGPGARGAYIVLAQLRREGSFVRGERMNPLEYV